MASYEVAKASWHAASMVWLELTEPEALADFLRRGSASASGSIDIEPLKPDRQANRQPKEANCASVKFTLDATDWMSS